MLFLIMISMIVGVIERFDEYYVVIRTHEGEILYWPKRDIPEGSGPGSTVYATLSAHPHMIIADPKQVLNALLIEAE